MHGDEFHSYIVDMDGNLLQGTLPSEEEVRAIRMAKADRKGAGDNTYPSTGSPRSLVLLFGFSDQPFGQTREDFDKLLNQSGYSYNGATGSCRDYYIASSDSIFQPQFDVYGPYQLSKTSKQYTDAEPKYGTDAFAEAVGLAAADGLDFSKYDENNDGVVDNVFFYYAGNNQAEGAGTTTIWPHQSSLERRGIEYDGKVIANYACTSEYRGANGTTRCGIGTFCHEFGHVLGQPDFYDTDYNYYSVGNWDVMCSGSYNNQGRTPPTFSAYERFYMGWLTPKQLTRPGVYMMESREKSNDAYLLASGPSNLSGQSPNPSEFFILEYRDGTGWDRYLPGHGMLAWHIDYSPGAWGMNRPNNGDGGIMRMHLEEANGRKWQDRANGESGSSSDPYPGTKNVTAFNPVLHNGSALGTPIFNIVEKNGMVQFVYISAGESSLMVDNPFIDLVTTMSDRREVVDWHPQFFHLTGSKLDPNDPFTMSTIKPFYLYCGDQAPDVESSAWTQTLRFSPENDSTLNKKIWVSYVPAKRNCTPTTKSIPIQSRGAVSQVTVTGVGPRATYVTAPELTGASMVTPTSFVANWKPVDDAVHYYLTLYSLMDGTSDLVQGFEHFDNPERVKLEGWTTTTYETTTSARSEGTRSLLLKNTGDQITSQIYPVPLEGLSYWLNAMSVEFDTIGTVKLEAYNGDQWVDLGETYVTAQTRKKTMQMAFDTAQHYTRLRLTYESLSEASVALDAFTAHLSKNMTYVYQGREKEIDAVEGETNVSLHLQGLQPSTQYFYQVQTSDDGRGCEEHLTDLSAPTGVVTVAAPPKEKSLLIRYDHEDFATPTLVVCVENPQDGDLLGYYDMYGHLLMTQELNANDNVYAIPVAQLKKGDMYIVGHLVSGKMKRKYKSAIFYY